MCKKHKPETRVSERHKPGFRVWQNELVSPGFPKPGFQLSIPILHEEDCELLIKSEI